MAQYADACNLFVLPNSQEEVKQKLHVLREHCETLGRPYTDIEKTAVIILPPLSQDGQNNTFSTSATLAYLRELAELGIEHAIFPLPSHAAELTSFDLFAREVIPQVEQMQAIRE